VSGILRAEGDWQAVIASALAMVARPIPIDPRLAPRRAAPDPTLAQDDLRRFDRSRFPSARQAATLLLLYPDPSGELLIPLTVRHQGLPDHPGEVSLPGGAVDPEDETIEATALREANEEVGLDHATVRVVGRLDAVWIPVSNFELTPVVAVADTPPALNARAEEVAEILEFPLQLLLSDDGMTEEDIVLPEVVLRTGVYRWNGHRVWGATARTLSMLGSALMAAGSATD